MEGEEKLQAYKISIRSVTVGNWMDLWSDLPG